MEFNATFLIAALSFLIFVFVMNKILYKPMEKIVQMREKYISDNETVANEANLYAQSLIDDKNEKTKIANQEAGTILSEKSNAAKDERAKLLNDTQNNCRSMIDANKKNLLDEKISLKNVMQNDTQDIADSIVAKFLGD